MKKLLLALSFFIFGIGVSYFVFNHSIVSKKLEFNDQIDLIIDSNLSAEETNGKIFQLLFAYFAIDLRDIEKKITQKIQESIKAPEAKVIEKIIEKVVYIQQEEELIKETTEKVIIPRKKHTFPSRKTQRLQDLNLEEYLRNTSPILERDKEFEKLNGTHRFIGHNSQGPNFQIEIENLFKLEDKTYRGTSKINYLVLGKVEDAIIVDGMPLNFLKNNSYPKLVAARISKDRYIVINTSDEFYDDGIRGVLFIRSGDNFKRDGLLRLKSRE